MTKLGVIILVVATVLLGGLPRQQAADAQTVGWTCLPSYGGCDEYGPGSTANATVGLPFEWRLTARCNTGEWSVESAVVNTGRLPPGLEIEPDKFRIVGVPTRAGSFSFQMLFRGISCPGSADLPYGDWSANFTIIATGS